MEGFGSRTVCACPMPDIYGARIQQQPTEAAAAGQWAGGSSTHNEWHIRQLAAPLAAAAHAPLPLPVGGLTNSIRRHAAPCPLSTRAAAASRSACSRNRGVRGSIALCAQSLRQMDGRYKIRLFVRSPRLQGRCLVSDPQAASFVTGESNGRAAEARWRGYQGHKCFEHELLQC